MSTKGGDPGLHLQSQLLRKLSQVQEEPGWLSKTYVRAGEREAGLELHGVLLGMCQDLGFRSSTTSQRGRRGGREG